MKNKPHYVDKFSLTNKTTEQHFLRALLNAVNQNELCLHYQPRFDCRDGQPILFEALIRWKRPQVGLLYPDAFLPTAAKHDLMFNISMWVFQQACTDLIWMRKHIHERCRLSINISLRECESIYHAQKLYAICNENGLSLADFEFEITENICPQDSRKVLAFCDTLTNLGATFSLDDFGTSYSPLSNLCTLPITTIKIDRHFVKKIQDNYKEAILVSNLINLAQDMNITTVAEGVETEEQANILLDMGCDELQGFYLCRPQRRHILAAELSTTATNSLFTH